MKKMALAMTAVLALSACATKEQSKIEEIAKTPLRDLNLKKVDIPDVLQAAVDGPYAIPVDQACPVLTGQLAALDELLGPDIDVPDEKLDFDDKARLELSKAATGALQNTVEGAIPFRGWVRKLTGAERHARHVQEAVLAGKIRRGFLKGIMQSQSCRQA